MPRLLQLLAAQLGQAGAAARPRCRTTTGQLPGMWHDVAAEVTMISISDPDVPDGAPIYEGLDPAAALVDGSYPALLSAAQLQEPLLACLTIAGSLDHRDPSDLTSPGPGGAPCRTRARSRRPVQRAGWIVGGVLYGREARGGVQ